MTRRISKFFGNLREMVRNLWKMDAILFSVGYIIDKIVHTAWRFLISRLSTNNDSCYIAGVFPATVRPFIG